ncbi:MAG: hemerythrin domain-containing protein [Gammaproteobacteria bacterium]|nr:hemerythrin domain-containing protein [Gammaproteobacteria bacterium]NIR99040.1 hemerythrin domain-containing protein [Gammaproteobacteria bacterium]NIT64663.1 hemerythrin domain-containing protein [Gammaproteobacteria bacterium]NIY33243.1 hemerythrin domain-containing protein [Gammaproteobacteria bacterium]
MFFRNKNRRQTGKEDGRQEYKPAPGTDIRFDPDLINQLKGDHQALLKLYGEIKSAFDAQKYDTVAKKLGDFRSALQAHLLTENIRLYIYLSHMFKSDDINFELVRGFRKEMDGIAKAVMDFLKKYDAIGVDPKLAPDFAKDFAGIGEVLGARIQKEEKTLYPLYMEQY